MKIGELRCFKVDNHIVDPPQRNVTFDHDMCSASYRINAINLLYFIENLFYDLMILVST